MNRFTSTVIFIFAGAITLCGLLIALTSAGASLANGVATAASSTALMTSQCVSAFMVVVAIIAGVGIGSWAVALRSIRQERMHSQARVQMPFHPSSLPAGWQYLALPEPKEDDDELTKALVGLFKDSQP